ncbi:MAG: cbb3-type cytochrome c oxidase subunit I [bacterium]|nr:cbb3-type cytochrome c oxidase subunit I [bacterium]
MIFAFHKLLECESRRIGFLYLVSCAVFLLVGTTCALAVQIDLSKLSFGFLDPEQFGKALTQHGMVMVFVFLLPLMAGTLGNFALPAALGVRNLAMPGLNLFGWFCHVIGGILILVSVELGSYTSGWTMLMPPTVSRLLFASLIVGLSLCACSLLIQSLCVVRSILSPGHRATALRRFPLFVWFFLFWAVINVLVAPVRLVTLALTLAARNDASSYLSLIDPAGIVRYQQLFWFYAGTAVLAALLPAIGTTFEILSAQTRYLLASRTKLVVAGVGLSFLIMLSWGQNLITAADQEKLAATGSLFAALTTVPLLLIVVSWLSIILAARKLLTVPLTFIWIQLVAMTVALLTTLALAIPALGVYLHNSYFTVAQLHLVLLGTVLTSFLAGLFHWLPTLTNREYSRSLGFLAAAGMLLGGAVTFVPQFILGTLGSPKGLHSYPEHFQTLHVLSSIGAIVLKRFFKVYADSIHHHAEESLLFDPLAEIAPKSLRRMMEQLVTQHVMGRFLVHRISEAIDGAATGLRGWRKIFVSSAQAYDTLLSCHICSEDHHVFPIADRLIEKRSLRIKAESTLTLKQRILLEKSLSRLVSRYGVADQSSGVFQNCDRNTMR